MDNYDNWIFSQIQHYYRGTVRVPLASIKPPSFSRAVDEKNIERLVEIFKREGCLRSKKEHFAQVLIDPNQLAKVEIISFLENSQFTIMFPPKSLECIHGWHRLLAARKLPFDEHWWPVDLYVRLPGIYLSITIIIYLTPVLDFPLSFLRHLGEYYPNSQRFSDGDIFYKIRKYHHQGDKQAEDHWWCLLSKAKAKDLKQLLKHVKLISAFDRLLVLPALWTDIQLGILHRLLPLHCQEEVLSYLDNIYLYWFYILDGNEALMQAVDISTCRQLQCRAPTISRIDKAFIKSGIVTKKLFPLIQNLNEREQLLKQILSIQAPSQLLIPTLFTLFENLKLLEVPATILKSFLDVKPHDKKYPVSMYQAFKSIHYGNKNLRIGYQRLWFFTLTNFAEMLPITPKKEKGREKPITKQANPILWAKLAQMAISFGFNSSTIREKVLAGQKDTKRKVEKLIILQPHLEPHATLIAQILDAINDSRYQHDDRSYQNIVDESIERRLGRPFETAYNYNLILKFNNSIIHNGVVTPELVLRTIFCAFFGNEELSEISPKVIQSSASLRESAKPEWAEPESAEWESAEPEFVEPESAEWESGASESAELVESVEREVVRQLFTVHIQKLNQVPVTLKDLTWVKLQKILYNALNIEREIYIIKDNQGYVISREQVEKEEEIFLMQVPITFNLL